METARQKTATRSETFQPAAVRPLAQRKAVTGHVPDEQSQSRTVAIGGIRLYLTREAKLIELPPELTDAEAAKLEAEGSVAEKKLGKGPAPKPVRDPKRVAAKEVKKEKTKPKAKRDARGKSRIAARAGATTAASLLGAVGPGNVARYLAAKGTPVLFKGISMLQNLKQNEQTHDDAAEKLKQSEKAVIIPPSEGQSKSNAGQVNSLGDRPAPAVDENKAKQKLQESLAENVPQSIEDVDNFKRDQKARHMGADVMGVVLADKNAVTGAFDDIRHTPPPMPPEHTPEAIPPLEIAQATPVMNLGQGAIAPLLKEHTDLSNYTKEADSKLKDEGVTQEQLDMVDSGDLAEANREKKGLEKTAQTGPLAVQTFVRQQAGMIDKDLRQEEKMERDRLTAKRKVGLGATSQRQKAAKTALEKKRDEVAGKINGMYQTAQDKVKKRLAELETQSIKRFEDGNAKATKEFEDNVKRELDAYKDDRYSGWFGWARKAKDWLLGMDELPKVKEIFERNRTTFVTTINKLVEDISADNKRVIKECKDELTNAQARIKEFVDKLEPGLKEIGAKAAEEMNAKLADLDQFISQKEEELKNKLMDKQTAAIKAIDEKIEKMKDEMSGALAKLGKLLLLAAKKFFSWALEKFGVSLSTIEGIISKGVAVLKAIFAGPIRFVKNLISAASTGFQNFAKHFITHLKNAVFEWLTGSLEGLILPESWDLKGILSVVFQILGITYQNIRAHLVKLIPEPVVKTLETSFTLVKTLISDGPMAAWEQLKQIANEMKEAFIDAVKEWIKWKVVQEAIKTVLAMFIPGAGIIRAIIAIYDTIVFFIQKAKDIMQMIGNFLGSIAEIAAGNIAAAADALENGLARGLKLVIDFLARFLRLSGITGKIREAIQKIRGKVDDVIDKVAQWIVTMAKKLFGAIKSGAKRLLQWWKKKVPLNAEGESHTLSFDGSGADAKLAVHTRTTTVTQFVQEFLTIEGTSDQIKKANALDAGITATQKKIIVAEAKNDDVEIDKLTKVLDKQLSDLGLILEKLMASGEAEGSEKKPLLIDYPKRRASAYPDIFVGPESPHWIPQTTLAGLTGTPKNNRIELKAANTGLSDKQIDTWDGKLHVYRAIKQDKLPDGEVVGLAPQFASLAPGMLLTYDKKFGTGGGGKINDLFRPYGYRPGKDGNDGDHVLERQLGGPDKIENLWPLPASENRSSGSTIKNIKVKFKGRDMPIHEARAARKKDSLFLLIRSVKSA
ncbi:MAG: hypothetical protein WC156_08735 [Pedobacter sp.]